MNQNLSKREINFLIELIEGKDEHTHIDNVMDRIFLSNIKTRLLLLLQISHLKEEDM